MALLPSIFCELLSDIEKPLHLLEHHFCPNLGKTEVLSATPNCVHVHYKPNPPKPVAKPVCCPPPKPICCPLQTTFELTIDMQQYSINEIHVSTVGNVIVVEAKHEEKCGDQLVTREFLRRCTLPEQNDVTKVQACLSADGVLKITAPKKAPCCKPGERIIPVCCKS
ncbi:protein lethal(2)essential for life-like [Athalia rosae]|uniref:protein lethal(2)essential for life-like n=1 Tax=Athalia rosae TaxID=37344 RepID=UPI00062521FD|nr:protein lethal(2)essential for life-like [Athalia rosae]